MKYLMKRMVAVILILALLVPIWNIETGWASEEVAQETTMAIHLEWEESVFKEGTAFYLQEDCSVSNAVKMKISYNSLKIREEGYEPGELILSVKGIGGVNRGEKIEALVGADKEQSSVKTRDWSYTWNKANDTYTLTNNEEIKPNSVFSGYLEFVWNIQARESIHGYTQDGIQAILYFPDGEFVQSEKLFFSNETKADTFSVQIEQHELYSYEGLTESIENPEDYIFIRYNLGASDAKKARGLKEGSYYQFYPDCNLTSSEEIEQNPIVISTHLSCVNQKDGSYLVDLRQNASMTSQYIFVAYPKEIYEQQNVKAKIAFYGAYYEGDDNGNEEVQLLASDDVQIPLHSDFQFVDWLGSLYDFFKDTYYDKYVSSAVTQQQGGDINGSKIKNGTVETFYLEGALSNVNGTSYTFELVDDFLYIMKNDGTFRQLEPGEYEFKRVMIPGTDTLKNLNQVSIVADTYVVKVYGAMDGSVIDIPNMTPVFEGVITTNSQVVELAEGTTAMAVVFENIKESMQQFSVPVQVAFHTHDTSSFEISQQDNLISGQIVNTAFTKLYDAEGTWINSQWTEDNYIDGTNLNLAQKDIDIYGTYLDREKDNITFYEGEKSDYAAYTQIESVNMLGNRLQISFVMGATFDFAEDEKPNCFSLYSILPEGVTLANYKTEEDIWDIMTLSGLGIGQEELVQRCIPEVISNYKGSNRTYLALHFNLEDMDLDQSKPMYATFQLKANKTILEERSHIFVRSCVVIDEEVLCYNNGKVEDNGSWGDVEALFADIDQDDNAEEWLSYQFDYVSYVYADSSQFQMTKYVWTSYSDGWAQLPEVPEEVYGKTYQYKLSVKNGNSTASEIVIMDILENGEHMQWQGTLQSVDLSACEALGLQGTIYYSEKENPGSLDSGDWSKENNIGTVKAIAVDFGDSILQQGQELEIVLHMEAPEDQSLRNQITENGFSASLTMSDLTTGNVTRHDHLLSNYVQVKLTPALTNLIVTKEDQEDGTTLAGGIFSLIHKATGEVLGQKVSNSKGYAIFHDVPMNDTYIIREEQAPYGYELAEDMEVTIGEELRNVYVTVQDIRQKGTIAVYKGNQFDQTVPVEGAEYALLNTEKNTIATIQTDANGMGIFQNIPWGVYWIRETKAPDGYQLSDMEYMVEVNRENVSQVLEVNVVDCQEDTSVILTKYVSDTKGNSTQLPLAGATFELVRVNTDGTTKRIGLYVTGIDGTIVVSELPYGTYYFKEYRTPVGYETAEQQFFSLSPSEKEASVVCYNKRKSGSVVVIKKDDIGNVVEGVTFGLYDQEKKNSLGSYCTDEYGNIQIDGLEWGVYYLKEESAPDCYELDEEWKEIVIDARQLKMSITCINKTKKGSIILKKTDETEQTVLCGATYCLYTKEGEILGTYTTDENGEILIENIPWGSYYLKEEVAPIGYGISEETVRFSVNAANAGMTQYLYTTDPKESKCITLTKKILAKDINFHNGAPTFLFCVKGEDVHGVEHVYYRMVTFPESYVTANVKEDGYVYQSVTVSNLTAGTYCAMEEDCSRYCLEEITEVTNGIIEGEKVVFDLVSYEEATATFINKRYENQGFSDNQISTNVLKKHIKLTALKVSYAQERVEAESVIDRDSLQVVALYDDGTTKAIDDAYCLSMEQFPNINGEYTVLVSYTERGITRTADFSVIIYGMKKRIISLEAKQKEEGPVIVGTTLLPEQFEVTAVYNDGERRVLTYTPGTTISSPNYPSNYPNSMSESINYWEYQFEGAARVMVVFDENSETEKETFDYIQIYNKEGSSLFGKLGGTYFAGRTYIVEGDYVKVTMVSDSSVQRKGFLATIIPVYDGTSTGEYIVSPIEAPSVDGQFDVTISLNQALFPEEKPISTTISLLAKYKDPILAVGGTVRDSIPSTTTKVVFTDQEAPTDVTITDVSHERDGSVVSWREGTILYISTQKTGIKVIANENCSWMFNNKNKIKEIDFTMLDTSQVTTMKSMFNGCWALEELDLHNFDTRNVTDMSMMFFTNKALKSLNVSSFDTSQVTTMEKMFYHCKAMTALDLSSFHTTNVTNIAYMFTECNVMSQLDIGNFNTMQVTDMRYMLDGCRQLVTLKVGEDFVIRKNATGLFCNCEMLTGEITLKEVPSYYNLLFDGVAIVENASVMVHYTADVASAIEDIIATKSETSNVVIGQLVE